MDKKTFTIGVLSLSALVLLVANLIQPRVAEAGLVVKDNEYTAVTARVARGGEALYILDNRSGLMAVVAYDISRKGIVPLAPPTPLTNAFNPVGGRGPAKPGRP